MLALEDFEGMSEEEIRDYVASEYSEDVVWDRHKENWYEFLAMLEERELEQKQKIVEQLDKLEMLIALKLDDDYESSSFFLFKDKETNKLYELHASHCSCYGYEGQFELEETSLEFMTSTHFVYRRDKEIMEVIFKLVANELP